MPCRQMANDARYRSSWQYSRVIPASPTIYFLARVANTGSAHLAGIAVDIGARVAYALKNVPNERLLFRAFPNAG